MKRTEDYTLYPFGLRRIRQERGLSAMQVACAAGVNVCTIHRIEDINRIGQPTKRTMMKLCNALKVTTEELSRRFSITEEASLTEVAVQHADVIRERTAPSPEPEYDGDIMLGCGYCDHSEMVRGNEADYLAWRDGTPVETALPYLTSDQRYLLDQSVCPACRYRLAAVVPS